VFNNDGIRVTTRNEQKYVINIGERWYYYDSSLTLRGHYDTEEEAIAGLKNAWNSYKEKFDQPEE